MEIKPGQIWARACNTEITLILENDCVDGSVWVDLGYGGTVYFHSTIREHFEYIGEL